MAKTDILKDIVAKKKEKILLAKQALPEEQMKLLINGLPACRPFNEAITKPRQISLIAEVKKASPSQGIIRENFSPPEIARAYQEAGVQAISVLTEEDHFSGSLTYIKEVKALAEAPVLRKDFILEPYQVYESRYFGADAILLIADLLTKDKIIELTRVADSLGIDYIVEVHDEKELRKVLNLEVPVIGINNRDLHTLEVDFKITEKLFPL
ncbi:MAG: indole-3-glycerol phosphate synthase TrpC, partial [Candidatus Omnitrophota bacterium]|nr:indole-3-glycerol phosphate synthase TrpC [Candidatus Omnitrophota bacterium]